MRNIIVVFLIAFMVFGFGSCKKNPVEIEEEKENLLPGRRDYTWTVDTLNVYNLFLSGIWGKTPDNVLLVGTGGGKLIWKYNGVKWAPDPNAWIFDPIDIYATENNIWVCGMQGQVHRLSGDNYIEELNAKINNILVSFNAISGKSSAEVYAVGALGIDNARDGYIYKYSNSKWELYKILYNKGIVNQLKYSSRNGKYYFGTYIHNNNYIDTIRLYDMKNSDMQLLYEKEVSRETGMAINTIDGHVYVTHNFSAFRYNGETKEKIFDIPNSNFGGQLWGRGRNDILIRMFDGIAHYNGTDIQYVLRFPADNRLCARAMVFEKEVFVPAIDFKTGHPLIYHGVLN